MIFLTVGSALPFDRLVRLVDDAIGRGLVDLDIFAQIGDGTYHPRHMRAERFVDGDRYQSLMEHAEAIVSHAGIGTISSALKWRKAMLVMPRLKQFGELVDDHQRKTAKAFSDAGHLMTFEDLDEFVGCTRRLATFLPEPRCPNRKGVADDIQQYMSKILQSDCDLRDGRRMP